MHEVQALMRLRLPGATSARTDWMFGFQRRGVRRCECDTDIPKPGPLPQTSQLAATVDHSQKVVADRRCDSRPRRSPSRSLTVLRGRRRRAPETRVILGDVGPRGYPPAVLQALDDAAAGRWCRAACSALSGARARLDDLNVFPGPDGDTGTNLLLTAEAALAALDEAGADGTESAWIVLARGAVLGARGNSGTILAQLFRGLADQLAGDDPADGPTFALAMQKAAETAYTAVADPEEGTFLTVGRGGARAAVEAV